MPKWKPEFFGGGDYSMDSKRRIKFPSDWAPEKPEEADLVLALVPDAQRKAYCIRVMEIGQLREIDAKIKNQLADGKITSAQSLALRRIFFDNALKTRSDTNGRLTIPERLLEGSKIKKSVRLAGMGEWFEIWDADTYNRTAVADIETDLGAMDNAGI